MVLLVGDAAEDAIDQDDIKDISIAGSIQGNNVSAEDYVKETDYNVFLFLTRYLLKHIMMLCIPLDDFKR